MQAELYDIKNTKIGTTEVPDSVFGTKWNPVLVKQAILAQLANKRIPWAHAKGRGEVRGGGKKPWRQKGTGRARHGSIRSPLWIGGGKAHGPNKEKDYSQKINKKMKRVAIMSLLSKKFKDGELKFLDSLEVKEPKTKQAALTLSSFTDMKKKKADVLMIPNVESKNIYRASANIPKAKAISPLALNVYDLMNHKQILIDQKAVEVIEKHYALQK